MHIINILIALAILYWTDILLVIVAVCICIWLLRKGKKDLVVKIVANLVVKAQAALGSGTGELKFNMVYTALPAIIRLLFTQAELTDYINKAVVALNIYLGQGKNLMTYNQEVTILTIPAELIPSNAEINNIP